MKLIDFVPIDAMIRRVNSSRDESDTSFFFDLLLLGEMFIKLSTLFFVSNLKDDVDKTRYRLEYSLLHSDGLGDYVTTLSSILTGNASNSLPIEIQEKELIELTLKSRKIPWAREALLALKNSLGEVGLDSNDITEKNTLLTWFSKLVYLRNKTRGHGAITSEKSAKAAYYLEQSIEIMLNNFSMMKRPWAYLRQNMSGSYRVSPIDANCVLFDYLKKKNNGEQLNDGVYCYTDRPRCLSLIESDSTLQSFSLPCGGFVNNKYEVLDYVSDDRTKIDGADYLLPPTKVRESATAGKSSLQYRGQAFDNLPDDLLGYIPRVKLENELREKLFDEERFPIVTLKGRGGIGKTSLAIHVVHSMLDSSRFDFVAWFSSRDIDLSQYGPQQVRATVINKEDIAKEYVSLTSTESKMNREEAVDLFTQELGQTTYGKSLFIFDNFETLTNPSEIYDWLSNSILPPNKILITSRLNRSFKADYPIEVGGMEEDESKQLITEVAQKLAIEPLLTDKYVDNLIIESEGHPYIIKITLGEVAKNGVASPVRRIIADKDKILEALFRRTYSTLSSAARRIFLTMCAWNSAIPELALSSVLLRQENEKIDVDRAIEELSKSSFIEISEHEGDLFLSVPLAAAIYGQKELEVSDEKMKIIRDKQLLMEFGADAKRGLRGLGPHIELKFKAVAKRITSREELENEIPMLEGLAEKYPKAWLLLAELYQEYGMIDEEKKAYKEYIKASDDKQSKYEGWDKLLQLCRASGDWDGECAAIAGLIQIPLLPFERLSQFAKRINQYYNDHQSIKVIKDVKKSLVELVINAMEARLNEADSDDLSRLSWLYLNLNNEIKALAYAERGMELDPDNVHCQRLIEKLS